MNNWIKLLLYLAIGFAQMGLTWWIGVHQGLDHMEYNHWYSYVFEALFYASFWSFIVAYWNQQSYNPEYEEWKKTNNSKN